MTRIHWEKEDRVELEKLFAENPHPDSAEKQLIADKLRVPIEKIVNFFKNKRQKLRRSGIAIKRVVHEESPVRVNNSSRIKNVAKSTPSIKHTKPALVSVKLEDTSTSSAMSTNRPPVIKTEKDDSYLDQSYKTRSEEVTNESAQSSSISVHQFKVYFNSLRCNQLALPRLHQLFPHIFLFNRLFLNQFRAA